MKRTRSFPVPQALTRSVKRRRLLQKKRLFVPTELSSQEMKEQFIQAKEIFLKEIQTIVNFPVEAVRRFSEANRNFNNKVLPFCILASVSPNKKIRKLCGWIEEDFEIFDASVYSRSDLYQALYRDEPSSQVGKDVKRIIMRYFLGKAANVRSTRVRGKIKQLDQQITSLEKKLSQNVIEEEKTFCLTGKELQGCPDSLLKKTKQNKVYIVPLTHSNISTILTHCSNESTRKKVYQLSINRAHSNNQKPFFELLKQRGSMAKMFGYDNFAQYGVGNTMASDLSVIRKFLFKMMTAMKPIADRERLVLEKEKGSKIELWDYSYYLNKMLKKEYTVDLEKIKDYFPVQQTCQKIMLFYEKMFSLRFEPIPLLTSESWHPSVQYYCVKNKGSSRIINYFYLDILQRPNKYSGAFYYSIHQGIGREASAGVLVANFTPQMSLHMVETFFHEFGHLLHQICNSPRYQELAWLHVSTDFVEAPSQMMENWAYEPELLSAISHHPEKGHLSEQLIQKINRSKKVGRARNWLRIAIDSLCDLNAHENPSSLMKWQMYRRALQSRWLGSCEPKGSHYYASWNHLYCPTYSARYWSYLWAKVIACDLYTPFREQGLYSEKVGAKYRRQILAPGYRRGEESLVRSFLGRRWSPRAFLESLNYEKTHL